MKRKTRLRYLYLIDPAQLQTWLEDESLRGWRLEKVWREWGKFRRAEPRRVRYRMEPDPSTLNTTDGDIAERDQLYADMGWQRVAGRTLAGLILYAAEDPDAPEPHTDADTLRAIWKREIRSSWGSYLTQLALLALLFWFICRLDWARASSLATISWSDALLLIYLVLVMAWLGWRTWAVCRSYRRLCRGGEPYRAYPTAWRGRWRRGLRWAAAIAALALVLAVGRAEERHRSRLTLTPVEGSVVQTLPEEVSHVDAEALGLEPGGDQRILYSKALHTLTACGYSTFSLYWDEGEGTVSLHTSYYHMRGDWLTGQVVEMLLDGTTETEELPLPGVDGAWQGREGDRQASPFVLVRRGNQAVYLQYDKTLEISPAEAAAAVVDLLDGATY